MKSLELEVTDCHTRYCVDILSIIMSTRGSREDILVLECQSVSQSVSQSVKVL